MSILYSMWFGLKQYQRKRMRGRGREREGMVAMLDSLCRCHQNFSHYYYSTLSMFFPILFRCVGYREHVPSFTYIMYKMDEREKIVCAEFFVCGVTHTEHFPFRTLFSVSPSAAQSFGKWHSSKKDGQSLTTVPKKYKITTQRVRR